MRHAVKDLGKTKLQLEKFITNANVHITNKSDALLLTINSQFPLAHFRPSAPLFRSLYPFLPFSPSDLSRVGNNFWDSFTNQKNLMENFFRKFPGRFLRQSDWLSLESSLFIHEKGNAVYRKDNSIIPVLRRCFPGFFWEKEWRFPAQEGVVARRTYLDGYLLGWFPFVRRLQDLDEIDNKLFLAPPRGVTVLSFYGNSHQLVFKEHYPELGIRMKNDGYWRKRGSVDAFITENFEVRTRGDFGELTTSTVVRFPGGRSLMCLNNGNVPAMVSTTYPELAYFEGSARGYWNNAQNNFELQKLVHLYQIKQKQDWYRISIEQLSETHGKKVARKSLMVKLLEYWYSEEEWNNERFSESVNKRARQRLLGLRIREIYEREVVFEDYVFKCSDRTFVFDFYIPALGCIIEYQGEQHYYDLKWFSFEEQRIRDQQKRAICLQNNLTFIGVPYWWDTSLATLQQIIQDQSPKTHPHNPTPLYRRVSIGNGEKLLGNINE